MKTSFLNKLSILLLFLVGVIWGVNAVSASSLKIGEKEFEDLMEAIEEANATDTEIVLQNDYT